MRVRKRVRGCVRVKDEEIRGGMVVGGLSQSWEGIQ
jgi:hypothetical protein